MRVPFMNLSDSIRPLSADIERTLRDLIDRTAFIGGEEVALFEKEFAAFAGQPYAVGCANGTDALILALKALGIGPGDKVVTVPHTFIATAEAVSAVGADVIFVDVDEEYFTMSPTALNTLLDQRRDESIKAVIPVHLYGQMADMAGIGAVARAYGLKVVEDSAQAHGALLDGRAPGSFGEIATYSFYPGKNLGAFGDAGAVVTRDPALFDTMKMLVNHGRGRGKYEHLVRGFNFRLDTLQAAILRLRLARLRESVERRIDRAAFYDRLLGEKGIAIPHVRPGARHAYHLYVIRHKRRDDLKKRLADRGIECGVHYPLPLHLQPAYADLGHRRGDFPVTERLSDTILSLPFWPEMTDEQASWVADSL